MVMKTNTCAIVFLLAFVHSITIAGEQKPSSAAVVPTGSDATVPTSQEREISKEKKQVSSKASAKHSDLSKCKEIVVEGLSFGSDFPGEADNRAPMKAKKVWCRRW
jgi:hypothetical protein